MKKSSLMNIFFIIDFVNKMNTENDMFGFFFLFLGVGLVFVYMSQTPAGQTFIANRFDIPV